VIKKDGWYAFWGCVGCTHNCYLLSKSQVEVSILIQLQKSASSICSGVKKYCMRGVICTPVEKFKCLLEPKQILWVWERGYDKAYKTTMADVKNATLKAPLVEVAPLAGVLKGLLEEPPLLAVATDEKVGVLKVGVLNVGVEKAGAEVLNDGEGGRGVLPPAPPPPAPGFEIKSTKGGDRMEGRITYHHQQHHHQYHRRPRRRIA
jgi:hypothetical protein